MPEIGIWLLASRSVRCSETASQQQEASDEELFFFEQSVFDGLHPLGRIGDLEGGGVFLTIFI